MMAEYETAVLTEDIPERGLRCGDVGTVVMVHGHGGYEVEFLTLTGETLAVLSLGSDMVRPIDRREIAHARMLERAA